LNSSAVSWHSGGRSRLVVCDWWRLKPWNRGRKVTSDFI
jgi:hypothetical protein